MKRSISSIILILALDISCLAFPCSKYSFDLISNSGNKFKFGNDLTISWSINTGFNNCGFNSDEISQHTFEIIIKDIHDQILKKDTSQSNSYTIPFEITKQVLLIVFIREIGSDHQIQTGLVNSNFSSSLVDELDSLNLYLLTGFFPNALTTLIETDRQELVSEIINEYNALFPEHYPHNDDYFNCYVDFKSWQLVKMPFAYGTKDFMKVVNKLTSEEYIKSDGFEILLTVTSNGHLKSLKVMPQQYQEIVKKALEKLSFDPNGTQEKTALILVRRNKNGKKYQIVNERALLDPQSKGFKNRFRYRGAVN